MGGGCEGEEGERRGEDVGGVRGGGKKRGGEEREEEDSREGMETGNGSVCGRRGAGALVAERRARKQRTFPRSDRIPRHSGSSTSSNDSMP